MNIFISHAVANKALARSFADMIEGAREDVTTFLASRPGDIRADEDWLRGIERALKEADAYVILLTPESVLRPWVNFEAGAAWFFRRQLVFIRITALSADDIPLPINSRQVYAIDNKEQLLAIFEALRLPLAEPELALAKMVEQAAAAVILGEDEPAWEGVQIDNIFYAWAGPLLALEDRDPVPPPAGLLKEIERRGLKPRWANKNRVTCHMERGLTEVFATDRRTWRRLVTNHGNPLMVGKHGPVNGAPTA